MRLIDADALEHRLANDSRYMGKQQVLDVAYRVNKAPTIEAIPVVHSQWTLNKDGSGTCQHCGMTQKAVWDMDNWQNFCGCCGADMRVETDENSKKLESHSKATRTPEKEIPT